MFHIYAKGNIVGGVEFVIKTWTFFILMHGNGFFFFFFFFFWGFFFFFYFVGQYVGFFTNKRNKMINFNLLLGIISSQICSYI